MKVLVKDRSISTSQGIVRNGQEVDLPEAEVKKIMTIKPKPAKKTTAKKKRARNKDGTLKADDPSTPENEAWEDA